MQNDQRDVEKMLLDYSSDSLKETGLEPTSFFIFFIIFFLADSISKVTNVRYYLFLVGPGRRRTRFRR
jgi:hypothetical protein